MCDGCYWRRVSMLIGDIDFGSLVCVVLMVENVILVESMFVGGIVYLNGCSCMCIVCSYCWCLVL